MAVVLGIHRDFVRHANGELQSFSDRWTELAASRGIDVRMLNAKTPEFFDALAHCDGFMWRFGYSALELELAKRVIQAIEHGMRIPVFPTTRTAWHFEDKIAQHYLLKAAACPSPRTHVLWSYDQAARFCETASYPFVAKLSSGIQSRNVTLVRNPGEAQRLINLLFRSGTLTIESPPSRAKRLLGRAFLPLKLLMGADFPRGLQTGYLLAQEFLPGNEFDTRITIIGNRAFAFRRMNRPGDFRASGSGRIDWNPEAIDLDAVHLAFDVSDGLQTQSLAVDVLRA